MSRAHSLALASVRAALADVDGLKVPLTRFVGATELSHLQRRGAKAQAKRQSPHTYEQSAQLLAWEERRQRARPTWIGKLRNPYSRLPEPKPWAAVLGPFLERAAYLRPERKNRKRWDRATELQLHKLVRNRTAICCVPQETFGATCVCEYPYLVVRRLLFLRVGPHAARTQSAHSCNAPAPRAS